MKARYLANKLARLETAFAAGEAKDDWVDTVTWDCCKSGCFGHVQCRFSESRQATEQVPCSVDEELHIMRQKYEEECHKVWGQGPTVSFADYLEYFCYLGPENLAEERRAAIEKVRGEESGA